VQRGEKARKDAETLLNQDDVDGALQALLSADSLLELAEFADRSWVEPMIVRGSVANRLARLAEDRREALEWIEAAVAHADRALAIDAYEARAFELRGVARFLQWYRYRPSIRDEADRLFQSARQDLKDAVEEDNTLASAHNSLSLLHVQEGDFTSASIEAARAYEADAYLELADDILTRLFWSAYNLEQPTQALGWCDEGRRRFPEDVRFAECQMWLLTTGAKDPDVDAAWQLGSEVADGTPEPDREFMRHAMGIVVGGVLARAELRDSARNVLVAHRAGPDVDPTLQLKQYEAYMRVLLGDMDEAIDLLREFFVANPEEDHGGGESGEIFWWWRELQNHPRFGEVMR
jgi:tetratricopeptide (TPR) repeat protein